MELSINRISIVICGLMLSFYGRFIVNFITSTVIFSLFKCFKKASVNFLFMRKTSMFLTRFPDNLTNSKHPCLAKINIGHSLKKSFSLAALLLPERIYDCTEISRIKPGIDGLSMLGPVKKIIYLSFINLSLRPVLSNII